MEEALTPTFPQVAEDGRNPILPPLSVPGRDVVSGPATSQRNTKRKRSRHTEDSRCVHTCRLWPCHHIRMISFVDARALPVVGCRSAR